MDAITQRMWDAEFEKQYPKPDSMQKFPSDECMALIEASHAALSASAGRHVDLFNVITKTYRSWKLEQESSPWSQWRDECLSRFQAIYKAQPLQALEALRNGNLLID